MRCFRRRTIYPPSCVNSVKRVPSTKTRQYFIYLPAQRHSPWLSPDGNAVSAAARRRKGFSPAADGNDVFQPYAGQTDPAPLRCQCPTVRRERRAMVIPAIAQTRDSSSTVFTVIRPLSSVAMRRWRRVRGSYRAAARAKLCRARRASVLKRTLSPLAREVCVCSQGLVQYLPRADGTR